MKEVVQAVRETILAADPRIDKTIKRQAPTFIYNGNLASFYPKSKKHASLMCRQGRRSRVIFHHWRARAAPVAS